MLDPFLVYTPIGESNLAKRIYVNYLVSSLHKIIPCDRVELDVVDFHIIFSIDWLHVSYAFINCRTRRVKFQFTNELVLQ